MKPARNGTANGHPNGHANGHRPRIAIPAGAMPPHNIEAEQATLGALLMDGSLIRTVRPTLPDPAAFFRDDHQQLYRAMLAMDDDGDAIDPITVDARLRRMGLSHRITPEDLSELVHRVPHTANIRYWAEIVADKARRRAVIEQSRALEALAQADSETAEALEERARALAEAAGPVGAAGDEAESVCLADVEPEEIRFLWRNKIPLGMISALVGDPGLGKSFITQGMAATISIGAPWPDPPHDNARLGSTIFLSAEDSLRQTIRPRLDAAGADVRKVHALTMVRSKGGRRRSFTLSNDLPALERLIEKIGDVRLVVIDPINAYLGGADGHKDSDIRGMLAPLKDIAERRDVAVLIVMHMNKSGGSKAMYRGNGSLAFIASARVAWLVAADPKDRTRRKILPIKANVIPNPAGIAYRIGDDAVIQYDPTPLHEHADEALAEESRKAERKGKRGPVPEKTAEAMELVREALKRGPARHGETRQAIEAKGYSTGTFYNALEALDVERFEDDQGKKWVRLKPGTEPEDPPAEGGPETIPFPDPDPDAKPF